jgi:hypothetical protein
MRIRQEEEPHTGEAAGRRSSGQGGAADRKNKRRRSIRHDDEQWIGGAVDMWSTRQEEQGTGRASIKKEQ